MNNREIVIHAAYFLARYDAEKRDSCLQLHEEGDVYDRSQDVFFVSPLHAWSGVVCGALHKYRSLYPEAHEVVRDMLCIFCFLGDLSSMEYFWHYDKTKYPSGPYDDVWPLLKRLGECYLVETGFADPDLSIKNILLEAGFEIRVRPQEES